MGTYGDISFTGHRRIHVVIATLDRGRAGRIARETLELGARVGALETDTLAQVTSRAYRALDLAAAQGMGYGTCADCGATCTAVLPTADTDEFQCLTCAAETAEYGSWARWNYSETVIAAMVGDAE